MNKDAIALFALFLLVLFIIASIKFVKEKRIVEFKKMSVVFSAIWLSIAYGLFKCRSAFHICASDFNGFLVLGLIPAIILIGFVWIYNPNKTK